MDSLSTGLLQLVTKYVCYLIIKMIVFVLFFEEYWHACVFVTLSRVIARLGCHILVLRVNLPGWPHPNLARLGSTVRAASRRQS